MDDIQLPTPQEGYRSTTNFSEILGNAIPTFQKDFKSLTENPRLWKKTLQEYEKESFRNRFQSNTKPCK